ncbi:MAG TPA: DUF3857 domain-containing transglutaminase family protein [Mucilaginibacter sp.]|jgi:hypothetical protein
MKNKYLNCLVFSVLAITGLTAKTYCQEKEIPRELYLAATIPDSLKENANSVLRYSMIQNEVKGPGKQELKVHYLVTILNEKADNLAGIALPYNKKFSSINSFEMKVYDADGKLLKKYRKGDMYDHAAEDDESIVTDDRVMEKGHTVVNYPATIEIMFEVDQTSLIGLGEWQIQIEEQSVQSSYYTLSISDDAGFRYLDKNTNLKPQKLDAGNRISYSWGVHNLKAIKLEDGAMPWRVLPVIRFTANKFEFYGQSGDISTWQSYGKWQQTLNSDVCTLSPERVQQIREMTDTIKTDKEKARFLYKYMQRSMRYVSIQLGIGGLKPFPATFVDQKKYGDCKALSNYMSALLKAVGINSYYAKINAGANEEPADFSFPYDYSNHIILCVPFKNDTTWLECTSNTQTFGKLGWFTENRNALIITEDGGKLVCTPKSNAQDNQFNSDTHLILDADGAAKAQVKILSTGDVRDIFVDALPSLSVDKQKEALLRNLNIKQPAVFDFKTGIDNKGIKEFNLDLDFDKYCDIKAGDKLFYHTQVLNFWDFTVPVLEKRKTDYYFKYPLQGSSATTIDLPPGFTVETLPVNQNLKFTYGNYEVNYAYDAAKNQVTSTAKFNLTNHVIPAAKYTELQQYLDAVAKAQNKKLVIRRKA